MAIKGKLCCVNPASHTRLAQKNKPTRISTSLQTRHKHSDSNARLCVVQPSEPLSAERHSAARSEQLPWTHPRTVIEQNERKCYAQLKERLTPVPSCSRHSRQTVYIDLWTGQHWLGITLSYPEGYETLKPISADTALSIANTGIDTTLNQGLFD